MPAYYTEVDTLQQLLADADRYPNLTAEEERVASPETLIQHNIRLVVSIARRRKRYVPDHTIEELVSYGMPGLMTAAHKFEGARNNRFGTLAYWWITQAMRRGVAEAAELPDYVFNNREKRKKYLDNRPFYFSEALAVKPRAHDLADLTFEDVLCDERVEEEFSRIEDAVSASAQADAILRHTMLTDRERLVLALRYGFYGDHDWTLEEIGLYLGITRERVRQLEAKALRLLRLAARQTEQPVVSSLSPTTEKLAVTAPIAAKLESTSREPSAASKHIDQKPSRATSSRRKTTVVRANKGSIARTNSARAPQQKKRPPLPLQSERRAS